MEKLKKIAEMENWETEKEQIAYYNEIAKLTPQERKQLAEIISKQNENTF